MWGRRAALVSTCWRHVVRGVPSCRRSVSSRCVVFRGKDTSPGLDVRPLETPRQGEVLVHMHLCPVHHADVSALHGNYVVRPQPGHVLGMEGVGRVVEVGAGVARTWMDRVVSVHNLSFGVWCEYIRVPLERACAVPMGVDPVQASMAWASPLTAHHLLHDFTRLHHGDWIVQNCANGAVGRCVAALAREMGIGTLNIVRRPEVKEEWQQLQLQQRTVVVLDEEVTSALHDAKGGDALTNGARRVMHQLTGDPLCDAAALSLNGIGGTSATTLAELIRDKGTHVSYGGLSQRPLSVSNALVIFRDIHFVGFYLPRVKTRGHKALMCKIFQLMSRGDNGLTIPVHAIYQADEEGIETALKEASQGRRRGKVLLRFSDCSFSSS